MPNARNARAQVTVVAWLLMLAACGGDSAQGAAGSGGEGGAAANGQAGAAAGTGGIGAAGAAGASGASGIADGGAGGTSAGAGGASSVMNETEACIEYVRVQCGVRARCSSNLPEGDERELEVRVCMDEMSHDCPDLMFSTGSQRTLDNTRVCIEQWRAITCDDYRAQRLPDCALPGTLAADAPCTFDMQCASRICQGGSDACGACLRAVALGGDCSMGEACGPGLRCESGTCQALPPPSAPSTETVIGPTVGEECDPFGTPCGGESWCPTPSTPPVYCLAWPTLGNPCAGSRKCSGQSVYCDGQTYECTASPVVDQECARALDTNAGICAEDLVCVTPASSCAMQPSGEVSCTQPPSLCKQIPTGGESCTDAKVCADGFFCSCDDASCTTRSCIHLQLPGEPCVAPGDRCIRDATRCEAGSCVVNGTRGLFDLRCGL